MTSTLEAECPAERTRESGRKRRYQRIAKAGQDILKDRSQTATYSTRLMQELVLLSEPALEGKSDSDIAAAIHSAPPETQYHIRRGQFQAAGSVLYFDVLRDAARTTVPILERGEPLVDYTVQDDSNPYEADVDNRYDGAYRGFFRAGLQLVQTPMDVFIADAKASDHPNHQLLKEVYRLHGQVRNADIARRKVAKHKIYKRGLFPETGEFENYSLSFEGNVHDMMLSLDAVRNAYIAHLDELGAANETSPDDVGRFVMDNYAVVSRGSYMMGERYIRDLFPRAEEELGDNPQFKVQLFEVKESGGDLRLALDQRFAYLADIGESSCNGIIDFVPPDLEEQAFAERVLTVGGIPSGREPSDPEYGKISPVTIFGVLANDIAKNTIYQIGL